MSELKSYEQESDELMKIYDSININNEEVPESNGIKTPTVYNGISVGDFVVFNNDGVDLNGEVTDIIDEKYRIRGNYEGIIKETMMVTFDQIIEHYPKNVKFTKEEEIIERRPEPIKVKNDDGKKTRYGKLLSNDEDEDEEEKVEEDFLQPSVVPNFKKDPNIGNKNKNVVFFPNEMKQKEIDKVLPNFNEAKYFIVEKNNETHIVRIKDGFEMKPFVENLINYLISNKMIKEDISTMKVVGNNSFCIIKNPPSKTNDMIKNLLKDLLK